MADTETSLIDHWRFGACRIGRTGGAGYQTFACSTGVTADEEEEMAAVTRFFPHMGATHAAMTMMGLKRLASGDRRWCFFQSSQGAVDDLGRPAYSCEAFLVHDEDLERLGVPTYLCYSAQGWQGIPALQFGPPLSQREACTTSYPGPLARLPFPEENPAEQSKNWVKDYWSKDDEARIKGRAVGARLLAERRSPEASVFLPEAAHDIIAVFGLLWEMTVPDQRGHLSFCTFVAPSNETRFTLGGWPVRQLGRPDGRYLGRYHSILILDQVGNPNEIPPALPAVLKDFLQLDDTAPVDDLTSQNNGQNSSTDEADNQKEGKERPSVPDIETPSHDNQEEGEKPPVPATESLSHDNSTDERIDLSSPFLANEYHESQYSKLLERIKQKQAVVGGKPLGDQENLRSAPESMQGGMVSSGQADPVSRWIDAIVKKMEQSEQPVIGWLLLIKLALNHSWLWSLYPPDWKDQAGKMLQALPALIPVLAEALAKVEESDRQHCASVLLCVGEAEKETLIDQLTQQWESGRPPLWWASILPDWTLSLLVADLKKAQEPSVVLAQFSDYRTAFNPTTAGGTLETGILDRILGSHFDLKPQAALDLFNWLKEPTGRKRLAKQLNDCDELINSLVSGETTVSSPPPEELKGLAKFRAGWACAFLLKEIEISEQSVLDDQYLQATKQCWFTGVRRDLETQIIHYLVAALNKFGRNREKWKWGELFRAPIKNNQPVRSPPLHPPPFSFPAHRQTQEQTRADETQENDTTQERKVGLLNLKETWLNLTKWWLNQERKIEKSIETTTGAVVAILVLTVPTLVVCVFSPKIYEFFHEPHANPATPLAKPANPATPLAKPANPATPLAKPANPATQLPIESPRVSSNNGRRTQEQSQDIQSSNAEIKNEDEVNKLTVNYLNLIKDEFNKSNPEEESINNRSKAYCGKVRDKPVSWNSPNNEIVKILSNEITKKLWGVKALRGFLLNLREKNRLPENFASAGPPPLAPELVNQPLKTLALKVYDDLSKCELFEAEKSYQKFSCKKLYCDEKDEKEWKPFTDVCENLFKWDFVKATQNAKSDYSLLTSCGIDPKKMIGPNIGVFLNNVLIEGWDIKSMSGVHDKELNPTNYHWAEIAKGTSDYINNHLDQHRKEIAIQRKDWESWQTNNAAQKGILNGILRAEHLIRTTNHDWTIAGEATVNYCREIGIDTKEKK